MLVVILMCVHQHCPNYCFIFQSLSTPSSVVVLDCGGVHSVNVFPASGAAGGDGHAAGAPASALSEILRQCVHCVFSGVDLAIPSAMAIVRALGELHKTVYVVHAARRVHRAFLALGSEDSGRENLLMPSESQTDTYAQLFDVLDPLNMKHMVSFNFRAHELQKLQQL